MSVAALGVLPCRPPREAGEDEHERGPRDGRFGRGRPDEVGTVVALAEAGERWAARIEVVHAGGEARQVGAREVDLDRVQGAGRGVVSEVDHVRAREGHDVVYPGAANEEAGERGKIRPRPGIANGGRLDRLEGGDTE